MNLGTILAEFCEDPQKKCAKEGGVEQKGKSFS